MSDDLRRGLRRRARAGSAAAHAGRRPQRHSAGHAPAHRLLRPAQRGQVQPAERHHPAGRVHRLGAGGHHHRPGGEAHGAAASGPGALHRHRRPGRRGRARRAAGPAHRAGVRPHRPGRHRHRGGRVGRVRGADPGGAARAEDAGRGRVQQDRHLDGRPPVPAGGGRGDSPRPRSRRSPSRRCAARASSTCGRRCSRARRSTSSRTRPSSPTWWGPTGWPSWWCRSTRRRRAGRLILPQVQSIRDLLDADAMALVVKERELRTALARLNQPPQLVVTDSQAFLKVAADTPPRRPHDQLLHPVRPLQGRPHRAGGRRPGPREPAARRPHPHRRVVQPSPHRRRHRPGEDPAVAQPVRGRQARGRHGPGTRLPRGPVAATALVVHCGACTFNRRAMLTRILRCKQAGVPITNYGLAIAYSLGIFERALQPFPAALDIVRAAGRPSAIKPLSMAGLGRGAGCRGRHDRACAPTARAGLAGAARAASPTTRSSPGSARPTRDRLEPLWRQADADAPGQRRRRGAPARAHRDLQPLRPPVRLLRPAGRQPRASSATA